MKNRKKLDILNDKKPIVINRDLAELVGLNESIILQQINYWTQDINKSKGEDSVNYKDDHYWTFNTYAEWQEQFPFWSISTIKRTIKKLEKRELIVTGNYNRMKIDRTKWYRIKYKNLDELCHFAEGQNEQFSWSDWADHLSNMNKPITRDYLTEVTNREKEKMCGNSDSHIHSYSFTDEKPQKLLEKYNLSSEIYNNTSYYLSKYREEIGQKHPNLTSEQWEKVFDNIVYADDVNNNKEFEVVGENFKVLVNEHFNHNYSQNIDYNILHFVSGKIMVNRYYSVLH